MYSVLEAYGYNMDRISIQEYKWLYRYDLRTYNDVPIKQVCQIYWNTTQNGFIFNDTPTHVLWTRNNTKIMDKEQCIEQLHFYTATRYSTFADRPSIQAREENKQAISEFTKYTTNIDYYKTDAGHWYFIVKR